MNFVTYSDIKSYLEIEVATWDSILTIIADAVNTAIERYLGRELDETSYTEYVDALYSDTILLKHYPVTELTKIEILSTALISTDYYLDSSIGKITLLENILATIELQFPRKIGLFPWQDSGIKVQYKAGYTTPPKDLKLVALETASWILQNRGHQAFQSLAIGDYRVTLSSVAIETGFSPFSKAILDTYQRII